MTIRARARPDLAGIQDPPRTSIYPVYNDTGYETQTLHAQDLTAIGMTGPNSRFVSIDVTMEVELAFGVKDLVARYKVQMQVLAMREEASCRR